MSKMNIIIMNEPKAPPPLPTFGEIKLGSTFLRTPSLPTQTSPIYQKVTIAGMHPEGFRFGLNLRTGVAVVVNDGEPVKPVKFSGEIIKIKPEIKTVCFAELQYGELFRLESGRMTMMKVRNRYCDYGSAVDTGLYLHSGNTPGQIKPGTRVVRVNGSLTIHGDE